MATELEQRARILAANLRRGAYVDDNNDEVADVLELLAAEMERIMSFDAFPEWVSLLRNGTEPLTDAQRLDLANILVSLRWNENRIVRQYDEARAEASQSRQAIDTYVEALAIERTEVARLRAALALQAESVENAAAEVARLRAQVDAVEALDPILWPAPGRYESMEATRAFRDGTQAQHDAYRAAITEAGGGW